ncbi:MAG TPA: hypothetical protein VNN20_14315 [Thermodesulfobacteriota bacterium]|nr:hypothetical protein [Thermodesulfobacteriota bacterium]
MPTLDLSKEILEFFDYVEGDTPGEKILKLIKSDLARRLRECEEEIYKFEVKYGSTFNEFADAWERGEIENKYSHRVERHYMVWEGLEAEKKKWLELLKNLE